MNSAKAFLAASRAADILFRSGPRDFRSRLAIFSKDGEPNGEWSKRAVVDLLHREILDAFDNPPRFQKPDDPRQYLPMIPGNPDNPQ